MTEHLTVKKCNTCEEEKDVSEFSRRGNRSGGLNYRCRTCQAEWYRKYHADNAVRIRKQKAAYRNENRAHVAKLKRESYVKHRFRGTLQRLAKSSIKAGHAPCIATEEEIREAFTGFCHACGVPEMECGKMLCLDHDHETGCFRGWLCSGCNVALGYLQNSAERTLLLAEYAEKHN